MKTVLYDAHVALGAKMVDFCGWQMPLQYKGVLHEQKVVREAVGLFDVSHMGRVYVEGTDAERLLDSLSTNKIASKPDLSATYTAWCLPSGGCVDDLIIYRYRKDKFFIIFNAGNRQKDLLHLKDYASGFDVTIRDRFNDDGILALQGPLAKDLIVQLFPTAANLTAMHLIEFPYEGEMITLSATGYTGAGGYEIFATNNTIYKLWHTLLELGKPFHIEPAGLGARDVLRLEMGYALYGHEIDESIAPIESVLAWAVKMNKDQFIGKEALQLLANSKDKRCEQGLLLLDPGVARENCSIFKDGLEIGRITSGGFSPSLGRSIAIGLLDDQQPLDEVVDIAIRKNLCRAKIVPLPFIKGKSS